MHIVENTSWILLREFQFLKNGALFSFEEYFPDNGRIGEIILPVIFKKEQGLLTDWLEDLFQRNSTRFVFITGSSVKSSNAKTLIACNSELMEWMTPENNIFEMAFSPELVKILKTGRLLDQHYFNFNKVSNLFNEIEAILLNNCMMLYVHYMEKDRMKCNKITSLIEKKRVMERKEASNYCDLMKLYYSKMPTH